MGYGAVASAGGNVIGAQLQGWASLLDKWAMADAYKAELARQAGYQKQASGVFNTQLAQSGAPAATGQLADAYGARLGGYNAIDNTSLGLDLPYQRSSSGARDTASTAMMAGQRANLNKYGDWMFGRKLGNMATGRELDRITNFAGGTASVFPYRMYDAQHAWDALAEIGSSISASSTGAAGVKNAFGSGPPSQSPGYGAGPMYAPANSYYGAPYGPSNYYDFNTPPAINPSYGDPTSLNTAYA